MQPRHAWIICTCLASAFLFATLSRAEPIRFKMTGTVTVYDPTLVLPEGAVDGAPFTAFLTYDDSVPDSLPDDPQNGRYEFDGTELERGLSLSVGDLLLVNDPTDDFTIWITNDISPIGIGPPGDFFVFTGATSLGGPDFGFPKIQMWWSNTSTTSSWDSDALPSLLVPDMFERADVLASGGEDPLGRPYFITAVVDEVRVVPEPRAWSISAIAILFLCHPFFWRSIQTPL